ncbi:hypothetical protein [Photobacterium damselae]|uniref:hypothetical protein n=1 Tax=Photobacterium damselae TaxID=38293 RepID=UPI001F1A0D9E|nr:hypothetical protein [Photobacterium damselae]UKA04878.1 hypothetical protein IHC89_21785 [Photobacterium damselae subsp. damselae]
MASNNYGDIPHDVAELNLCRVKGEGCVRKFDGLDTINGIDVVNVWRGWSSPEPVPLKRIKFLTKSEESDYEKQVQAVKQFENLKRTLVAGDVLYNIKIGDKQVEICKACDSEMFMATIADLYILRDRDCVISSYGRSIVLDYCATRGASDLPIERRVEAIDNATTTDEKMLHLYELRWGVGVGEDFYIKNLIEDGKHAGIWKHAMCVLNDKDGDRYPIAYKLYNNNGVLLKRTYDISVFDGMYINNYNPQLSSTLKSS